MKTIYECEYCGNKCDHKKTINKCEAKCKKRRECKHRSYSFSICNELTGDDNSYYIEKRCDPCKAPLGQAHLYKVAFSQEQLSKIYNVVREES